MMKSTFFVNWKKIHENQKLAEKCVGRDGQKSDCSLSSQNSKSGCVSETNQFFVYWYIFR